MRRSLLLALTLALATVAHGREPAADAKRARPPTDAALFRTARRLERRDRELEAQDAYRALVKAYPTSPLASDAWYAIAAHDAEGCHAGSAIRSLKHAAEDPTDPRYAWALYQLGRWSWSVEEYEEALAYMEAAVAATVTPARGMEQVAVAARADLEPLRAEAAHWGIGSSVPPEPVEPEPP